MDIWFYYDVTHSLHTFCNPISPEFVIELGHILDLKPGVRVLDIACGMGEMLIQWAEKHGISGVGVDVSPYALKRAKKRKNERVPDSDIQFILERGENYQPRKDEQFDVVMCIGASWIWKGFAGTLDALGKFVKPGGIVVSGEPHWIAEPPAEYLHAAEFEKNTFGTLYENVKVAEKHGMKPIFIMESGKADWDRYEMLQTASVDRFAKENPNHPDLKEIQTKNEQSREAHLRWGRDCFGFAFHVLRSVG